MIGAFFRLGVGLMEHSSRALLFRHDLSGLPRQMNETAALIVGFSCCLLMFSTDNAMVAVVYIAWIALQAMLYKTPVMCGLALQIAGMEFINQAVKTVGGGHEYRPFLMLWLVAAMLILIRRGRKLEEKEPAGD